MNLQQFRKEIESRLKREGWTITYDHKEAALRIVDDALKKGVTLRLRPLLAKWERKEYDSIDEAIRYVKVGLEAMKQKPEIEGNEKRIFPVIRSTSFPTKTKDGDKLLTTDHTAETRVYYAIDMGESYTLIREKDVERSRYRKKDVHEIALFNLRSLEQPLKEDVVAGNSFYFLRAKDGYDASRVLDTSLLERMAKQATGQLALAIPHQDVLIFADLVNERGYDVLAQIALQFFGEGRVPVTALPFLYENGELEPIFILAQRKPKQ